jgi:hypothetical protein
MAESGHRPMSGVGQNQTVANGIWLSAVQVDEQQCANQMARQLNWLRRGICD